MTSTTTPDRVLMRPVDLRERYEPAYGDTWDDVRATLTDSPADAVIIEHLTAVLKADGRFRRPVVLDPDERCVLDGMHRIIAAWEAGLEHIEVAYSYPPSAGAGVTVVFEVSRADGPGVNDAVEWSFEWLRSLPLDEDTWANCDAMGAVGHEQDRCELDALWYVDHDRADDLVAALQARAREHGWALRVISTTLETDTDTED